MKLIIQPHPCSSSERKLQQDIWNSTPPARSITVKGEEPIRNSRDRAYSTNVHWMYLCDAAGMIGPKGKIVFAWGGPPSIFQSPEVIIRIGGCLASRDPPCLRTGQRSPPTTKRCGKPIPSRSAPLADGVRTLATALPSEALPRTRLPRQGVSIPPGQQDSGVRAFIGPGRHVNARWTGGSGSGA
jgi:hypothetical protein